MEKKDLVIYILLAFLFFKIYFVKEDYTEEQQTDIKQMIQNNYKIDVDAIRNLSKLANDLTKNGKLVVPGGLEVQGGLTVKDHINCQKTLVLGGLYNYKLGVSSNGNMYIAPSKERSGNDKNTFNFSNDVYLTPSGTFLIKKKLSIKSEYNQIYFDNKFVFNNKVRVNGDISCLNNITSKNITCDNNITCKKVKFDNATSISLYNNRTKQIYLDGDIHLGKSSRGGTPANLWNETDGTLLVAKDINIYGSKRNVMKKGSSYTGYLKQNNTWLNNGGSTNWGDKKLFQLEIAS